MKEEDNIGKFFKDHLDGDQGFEFQESDWDQLAERLNAAGPIPTVSIWTNVGYPWKLTVGLIGVAVIFLLGWFTRSAYDGIRNADNEIIETLDHAPESNVEQKDPASEALKDIVTATDQGHSPISDDEARSETTELPGQSTGRTSANTEFLAEDKSESDATPGITQRTRENEAITSALIEGVTSSGGGVATSIDVVTNVADTSDPSNVEIKNQAANGPSQRAETSHGFENTRINALTKQGMVIPKLADGEVPFYMLEELETKTINSSYLEVSQWSTESFKEVDAQDQQTSIPLSKWSVAASIAPDINIVRLSDQQVATPQFGLNLRYHLNERISFGFGVFYSEKRYKTGGENYKPYKGYWGMHTNGVVPWLIDGLCPVIDMPLNLRYNWNPGNRLTIGSNIGVSSYILIREEYKYLFDTSNPGARAGWSTGGSSRYLIGLANGSVSLAWAITPNASIELEPYFKVPIRRIGFGNIRLSSWGTLISYRYRFKKSTSNSRIRNRNMD